MTAVDRNHLCRSALSAPLNQPVPPKAENDLQIQGRQIPRPRPALRNFIKETPLAGCGENGDDSNWKHCSWTHEQVGDGVIFWKLLDRLNPTIAELSQAIEQEVEKCREAQRRMTHPGVGPLTALAFVLIIGKAERFPCGKQIASYLGLVPLENSSGDRRRLGHITKQGSSMPRFFASGSGAGYGAQHPGMAEQVCPPDDSTRTQDREGGDGAQTGHCSLLDVA